MRLFTAIEITPEVKDRLRELVDRLRPAAKLSWSRVDNLHVTTKFIGEWPEPRLNVLTDALAEVPKPAPFDIAVRGLGWFPNPRNPRVFWAGIESAPELSRLAQNTENAVAPLGVPAEDRDYHPHLTLARRRDPVPIDALRRMVEALSEPDFGSFRATSFFLYLSAGGKYTKLQEYPFLSC